ncbi:hypothetical protein LT493_27080 [Streptomyces tricolor]|nr:hypothetical protein [Streptomyces tricolor]
MGGPLGGDAHTAIARAAVAVRLFAAQRRTWWETHARLVLLEARVAAGRRSGRMVADAAAVAERLTSFGSPAAPQASLLAGRIALALGWTAGRGTASGGGRPQPARRPAARPDDGLGGPGAAGPGGRLPARGAGGVPARPGRAGRPPDDAGRPGAARPRDRAGRRTGRAGAGGEPRPGQSATAAGVERAVWRATVLSAPPTRPPDDPVLLSGLTAYREIAARAEAARMEGRPVPALEREKRRLEREIRPAPATWAGPPPTRATGFDVRRLLDRLGDARLVELAVVDGRVHVPSCAGRAGSGGSPAVRWRRRWPRPNTCRPGCGGSRTPGPRPGCRWWRPRAGGCRSCCWPGRCRTSARARW